MGISLITAFLVSLSMHTALIVFGPDINYSDPPDIVADPIGVEMVKREVPIPDALRPKPLPLVPQPTPLDLNRLLAKASAPLAPPRPSLKVEPSLQRRNKVPKSRPLTGAPRLNLPKRVTPLDRITQDKLRALPKFGGDEEFSLAAPRPSIGLGDRKKFVLIDKSLQYAGQEVSSLTARESAPKESRKRIEGPAAMRRIVFRPSPPKARFSGSSGDITLRFWVLSDGTVGRVIPVRKGNAILEAFAVNHMKRWRFSPLPPDSPGREEWGLIVFRFRVR